MLSACPPPPPQDPIPLFSHTFLLKSAHVGGPRPPNGSTPPPTGNPGSATGTCAGKTNFQLISFPINVLCNTRNIHRNIRLLKFFKTIRNLLNYFLLLHIPPPKKTKDLKCIIFRLLLSRLIDLVCLVLRLAFPTHKCYICTQCRSGKTNKETRWIKINHVRKAFDISGADPGFDQGGGPRS